MITSSYPDPEKLLSWARYLYWADTFMKRYLDAHQESNPEPPGEEPQSWPEWWKLFAMTSHWYAAEYVVLEGWREIEASDSVIDGILSQHPELVTQLRRYRNAVYHFQPTLTDKRFREFLSSSMKAVPWLLHLHAEFLRYYWQFVENLPGSTATERAELRQAALTTVGWIPADIFPARLRRAEEVWERVARLTDGADSSDAKELRESAAHLLSLARKASTEYGSDLASMYRAEEE